MGKRLKDRETVCCWSAVRVAEIERLETYACANLVSRFYLFIASVSTPPTPEELFAAYKKSNNNNNNNTPTIKPMNPNKIS